MKWLTIALCLLVTPALGQTAHTGESCKTIQILKKEHPSQRIFYETLNSKRCYHVHADAVLSSLKTATPWVTQKDVSTTIGPPVLYLTVYRYLFDNGVRKTMDEFFPVGAPTLPDH